MNADHKATNKPTNKEGDAVTQDAFDTLDDIAYLVMASSVFMILFEAVLGAIR